MTDLFGRHFLAACLRLSSVYMGVAGGRGGACSHISAFMETSSHSSCWLEYMYFSSITASANMVAHSSSIEEEEQSIQHFIFRSATEKPRILLSDASSFQYLYPQLAIMRSAGTTERRTVSG